MLVERIIGERQWFILRDAFEKVTAERDLLKEELRQVRAMEKNSEEEEKMKEEAFFVDGQLEMLDAYSKLTTERDKLQEEWEIATRQLRSMIELKERFHTENTNLRKELATAIADRDTATARANVSYSLWKLEQEKVARVQRDLDEIRKEAAEAREDADYYRGADADLILLLYRSARDEHAARQAAERETERVKEELQKVRDELAKVKGQVRAMVGESAGWVPAVGEAVTVRHAEQGEEHRVGSGQKATFENGGVGL